VEISNFCRQDCRYCGIRCSNAQAERYRLTPEQILSCCEHGYELGFRTFVMQGGEDGWFTDERLVALLREMKKRWPDCAVTLSVGEKSEDSYRRLREAGADRFLLRHESADAEHYSLLHPAELTLEKRKGCLYDLKDLGYQVGCGFMVGSPRQTSAQIAKDLTFIREFEPQMVGIGPFIPHKDTPFANESAGTLELTLYLLSIVRIMLPNVLLPATTALGTIHETGRELGILAGANVCMPNLSPEDVRGKYMLYNNKLTSGAEAAEEFATLSRRMEKIGYAVCVDRGDFKK
jgi:biotin synthase